MRVAYLVLSHRNPQQVLRLARVLQEGSGAEVLIRHDQTGSPLDAADVEAAGATLVTDEHGFEWGGWSQFQRLLANLEAAAEALDPDWLLVLSGQDYPLRPLAEIESGLAESGLDAMLGEAWELPLREGIPPPPKDDFFLRYAYRHFPAPRRSPRVPGRLRPLAYLRERPAPLRPQLGLRRARLPFDRCYVSTDWLTLRRPALRAVIAAARERRDLMRLYRRSAIPTESFFATVLATDPSLEVSFENRRFMPFARPQAPHPETLTTADLDRLEASGADFARKFDTEIDAKVLDRLDQLRRAASPR